MAAGSYVVLYGDSVFLAGIQAELERYAGFELVMVEPGCPDVSELLCARKPSAVLFDLAMRPPDFPIFLLREQPGLMLIGLYASSNEMVVLSSHPAQALSIADLINVLSQKDLTSGLPKGGIS